jgi:nucleolar complex protein 3
VFRDVIPGYRIRPVEEKEQEGVAVSKEVKKLWEFESALLKGYQSYLKGLLEVGC